MSTFAQGFLVIAINLETFQLSASTRVSPSHGHINLGSFQLTRDPKAEALMSINLGTFH